MIMHILKDYNSSIIDVGMEFRSFVLEKRTRFLVDSFLVVLYLHKQIEACDLKRL